MCRNFLSFLHDKRLLLVKADIYLGCETAADAVGEEAESGVPEEQVQAPLPHQQPHPKHTLHYEKS